MAVSTLYLIEKVIRNDEKRIINYLKKIVGDEETARDIAQSAFLRTLEYAENTSIENPRGFIFKTASNLAKNEIRRRVRFDRRFLGTGHYSEDDVMMALESSTPSPEHYVSLRDDVTVVVDAIRAMPKQPRRAFILSRFEGRSYQEIALLLKVSESSVEKYIMDALRRLRRLWFDVEPVKPNPERLNTLTPHHLSRLQNYLLAEISA